MSDRAERHRVKVRNLLGDQWVAEVKEPPRPVAPEREVSAYTRDRLRVSLKYTDEALRYGRGQQNISPLTDHLLSKHESNLVGVLTYDFPGEKREDLIKDIIDEDRLVYVSDYLKVPGKESWVDLVARLSELRRYEYAVRYGDYAKDVCDNLKKHALVHKTDNYCALTGRDNKWAEIASQLKYEQNKCMHWSCANNGWVVTSEIPTHHAIEMACRNMGANIETTMTAISMYSPRDSIVHMSTMAHLERGHWDDLKAMFVRDLNDLPIVTPNHLKWTIPVTEATILSIIDRYFERDMTDPYDKNVWSVRQSARGLVQKLRSEHERENIEHERNQIAQDATKKFSREFQDYSLDNLVANISKLPIPTGALSPRKKRPPTEAELDAQLVGSKRRTREFKAMSNLAGNVDVYVTDYHHKYGSLEPPPLDSELSLEYGSELESDSETDAVTMSRFLYMYQGIH